MYFLKIITVPNVLCLLILPILCTSCTNFATAVSSLTSSNRVHHNSNNHHDHDSATHSNFEISSNQELTVKKEHNFRYFKEKKEVAQNNRNLIETKRRTTSSVPSFFRIGFIFPAFVADGTSSTDYVDNDGIQYLASFLLAVEQINNKTDGRWDDILPNSELKVVVRDSTGPFTTDIEAAIYQTTKAFNKSGIHAAIGASTNIASSAIAQIYNEHKINQVAYGSTGSFLSYVGPYPYYFRTIMDDAYQGYAIADIMFKEFGYSKISTFSTTNTLGTDGFLQFSQRADELGIEIISIHQFRPNQDDLSIHISNALDKGTRIFFIFMEADDAANLITQGYKKGLFKPGTFIFGNDKILSNTAWKNFDDTVDIQEVMKGVFALNQSTTFSSTLYNRFVSDWKNQNDTIMDKGLTSERCNNDLKDDDENFYLYKKKLSSGAYKCTGIEFSKVTSASEIAAVAPFVYDSVLVFAHALHELYEVEGYVDGNSMHGYDDFGDILGYIMTYNLTLTGITGDIQFRLGDSTGYGFGDREVGTRLSVLNFQPSHYCSTTKEGGPVEIGSWVVSTGYTSCTNDCTIVYSTADNSAPTQRPPPILNVMTVGLQSAIIVLGVVCLLLITLCFLFLYYNRSSRLVRSFQPIMLCLFLSGGVFSCMRQFVGGSEVTTSSCHMKVWFGHLAFAFAFMSLCIKTWRVHRIVNNATMKRVKISNNDVIRIVFIVAFMFSIYLLIYSAVGWPNQSINVVDLGKLQEQYTPICIATYNEFATTLYVIEGCLLVVGGRYCWLTRDVPDSINDSKSISLATYVIIFISAIVFCLVFLIDLDGNVKETIVCFGFSFATLRSVSFLFVPKMLMIWEGADLDSKMQIYYPNGKWGKNRKIIAGADTVDAEDDYNHNGELSMSGFINVKDLDLISRSKRIENVAICKEQSKRWIALQKKLEATILFDTKSNSGSKTSGVVVSQSGKSEHDLITADTYVNEDGGVYFDQGDSSNFRYAEGEAAKDL